MPDDIYLFCKVGSIAGQLLYMLEQFKDPANRETAYRFVVNHLTKQAVEGIGVALVDGKMVPSSYIEQPAPAVDESWRHRPSML